LLPFLPSRPGFKVTTSPQARPDVPQDSVLAPVDLNPAFAGIARGFLYLEHRKRRPVSIELDCDKPRIITPQGYQMVSGLVSFGPVFYENDFALLRGVAFGSDAGDVVPGARLKVVVGSPFNGASSRLVGMESPR
jgi:hypothetical protein